MALWEFVVAVEPCFCLRNAALWALASAASGSGNIRVSGSSVGHTARGPGSFTGPSFNISVSLDWAWCSRLPSCSSAGFKVATWLTSWRRLANLRRGHLLWGQRAQGGGGEEAGASGSQEGTQSGTLPAASYLYMSRVGTESSTCYEGD